jgi:threonylcarbamoyladenosine tRNA methylthiotransferase MtaB
MYEAGIKEITLTGIELASYEYGLAKLVHTISLAAPNLRIRLGSLEPRLITDDFCGILSDVKGFCPHFHLSLQSGCDDTLKRMGRKYGTERFYHSVELLRSYFDNCGITADLITGFPGETDMEFESTLGFLRKCGFSHVHVFPYSERRGTKAASMPDQVPKAVRLQRAAAAIAEAEITERSFLLAQVGRTAEVLFESKEGHTPNYCSVIPPSKGLEGKTVKAFITGVNIGDLSLTAII